MNDSSMTTHGWICSGYLADAPDLRVCRKTISQHQFSTATTDFFLFSVDRWLYLPAEGSISALFREFVS
ncbi:MAG: hypothetical protein NTV57_15185, partial [Cyanobacteria bacterium]|nr:hypothetical protein [Cyanobacteriota bacterium]